MESSICPFQSIFSLHFLSFLYYNIGSNVSKLNGRDSNHGPQVSEATALPAESLLLPLNLFCFQLTPTLLLVFLLANLRLNPKILNIDLYNTLWNKAEPVSSRFSVQNFLGENIRAGTLGRQVGPEYFIVNKPVTHKLS